MKSKINILVLADRPADSLAPICNSLPIPLLPLACKALIDHVLGAIAVNGPAKVVICINPNDVSTPLHLKNVVWSNVEMSIRDLAPRRVETETLVVRADMLPSPSALTQAMSKAREHGATKNDYSFAGIWWLKSNARVPTWFDAARVTGTAEIFFPDITAYHGLALRVARGELPDIAPGGWKTADGIREALDARIETRHAPGKGVEVGANAFVERHVILGDNVVLGERVYVAAATRLENVVVLPDTYVGPRLSLRDAVLAGRWIYRVDTGECARVADPRIVSRFAA